MYWVITEILSIWFAMSYTQPKLHASLKTESKSKSVLKV